MTREQLDAIENLENAATPAPWVHVDKRDGRSNRKIESAEVCETDGGHSVASLHITAWKVGGRDARPNANLIEALRNNATALISMARRALELEERLRNATKFKFAYGEHWSNDIDICRCEGHLLPKQPYMWAVRQGGNVLGKDGEWMYEPSPSSRDEEFYSMYRFDTYEDAERAAIKCVPVGAIQKARRAYAE